LPLRTEILAWRLDGPPLVSAGTVVDGRPLVWFLLSMDIDIDNHNNHNNATTSSGNHHHHHHHHHHRHHHHI
jgi:hypothetical protein